MAHDEMLAELDRRREAASAMGGPRKLSKRREGGQFNAQERLDALVDAGSFFEVGLLGQSSFDADAAKTPRDGKITGFGRIDGRDVGLVVNDFTTKGASTSTTNSKKIGYIRKTCTEKGMPFVHVGASTGARLPDAMGSKGMGTMLGNDVTQFRRMRDTPWAAAALDTSFGSSAWLGCCSDFAVMKKGSIMSVSSPRLVSMAIGENVDLELPASFDQLLTRGSTATGALSAPNALILSQTPETGALVSPITATGEVLITGTFSLPESFGSTGTLPGLADNKETDAVLVDGELPASSSPTPIAASSAISTIKSAEDIIKPPAPEKGSRLMLALVITAGALALALTGVLIVALVTGAFR